MDQNRKQDIALMRYSAISPLISGAQDDFPSPLSGDTPKCATLPQRNCHACRLNGQLTPRATYTR